MSKFKIDDQLINHLQSKALSIRLDDEKKLSENAQEIKSLSEENRQIKRRLAFYHYLVKMAKDAKFEDENDGCF